MFKHRIKKRVCVYFFFFFHKALAALVNIYVAALNTPGTVPSVQSAWETFVNTKCSEAKLVALQLYESNMTSQLNGALPCDSDDIRQVQQTAIEESMKIFQAETYGVSATSSEKFLDELMVREQGKLIFISVLQKGSGGGGALSCTVVVEFVKYTGLTSLTDKFKRLPTRFL